MHIKSLDKIFKIFIFKITGIAILRSHDQPNIKIMSIIHRKYLKASTTNNKIKI